MNRRKFLQTVGIGATATFTGSRFVRDTVATDTNVEGNWTRPWGTTGRTRWSDTRGSTDPYGSLDWEVRSGGYWSGTPTVSNGVLYVGKLTDDVSFTGAIEAYDTESGNRLWRASEHPVTEREKERVADGSKPLRKESSAAYGFLTHSPIVEDGVLYAIGRSSGDEIDYVAQGVYSLDAKTGEELWARTDLVNSSTLEVANGHVYLSGRALDARTGETVWETSEDEVVIGVGNGALYTYAVVSRPNDDAVILVARDVHDGAEKWRTLSPYGTDGLPNAVDEDHLYIVSPETPDENGIEPHICAISTTNGNVEWRAPLSVRDGTVDVSAPAVDDTSLYLFTRGTTDSLMSPSVDAPIEGVGTAFALDRKTGEERWRFETPAAFVGDPTVDADSVYAAARYHACSESSTHWVKTGLYTFDKQTGVERWNYAVENLYVVFSPAVADGRIFLATHGVGGTVAEATMYSFIGCECSPECRNQFADDGKTRTIPQSTEERRATTSTTTSTTKATLDEQPTTADSTTSRTTTDHSSTERQTRRSKTSTSTTRTVTEETSARTTTSDGQPGFGVLGAMGSVVGGGFYALRRFTDDDTN